MKDIIHSFEQGVVQDLTITSAQYSTGPSLSYLCLHGSACVQLYFEKLIEHYSRYSSELDIPGLCPECVDIWDGNIGDET